MRPLFIVLLASLALAVFGQRFEPNAHAFSCQQQKQEQQILSAYKASNSRTDTFDVQHYAITLGIVNLGQKRIDGNCVLLVKSKRSNLSKIDLDLLGLTVDSVKVQGLTANFTRSGELLRITLPFSLGVDDTTSVKVFYGGQPQMDASGWGGFYFSGGYAFNLGVGFAADPHNYGRAWFPCVDNFIDRATYDFFITTDNTNKAYCNGLLLNETPLPGNQVLWHWKLSDPIPTYLASVAVAAYTEVGYNYPGISDTFPVKLVGVPGDTANMTASFQHLNNALAAFEQAYGPQPFERVGFVLVPFNSGAMEHATNIAYPRYAANGNLNYETLYAHELSHHWWGDHITCKTAGDMWLNEGWASYSENLFLENVYGETAYHDAVRANHYDVLRMAHVRDDGFRAVSGVPHDYTYGDHVYNKGADVVHTLRNYMGDTKFFDCITQFQQAYAFQNVSSADFRDYLSNCSGIDLSNYFNDWIFSQGFAHFSVDSFTVLSDTGASVDVVVYLRQRLRAAPSYYSGVPIDLTYYSSDWQVFEETVNMSGFCGIHYANLPFTPVFIAVDLHEKISDATTDKYYVIDSVGTYDYGEALFTINVTGIQDSAFVRVEHNWVAPDPLTPPVPGFHLSLERYYKVDGIFPNGFAATASFPYDGTTSSSSGYLDNELLKSGSEDSLVLMYRRGASYDWAPHPDYTIDVQGSTSNKRGQVIINALIPGEYALGIYDASRSDTAHVIPNPAPCRLVDAINEPETSENLVLVYPNPAHDSFTIALSQPLPADATIAVYSMTGQKVYAQELKAGKSELVVHSTGWGKGLFLIRVDSSAAISETKRILLIE